MQGGHRGGWPGYLAFAKVTYVRLVALILGIFALELEYIAQLLKTSSVTNNAGQCFLFSNSVSTGSARLFLSLLDLRLTLSVKVDEAH